MGEEHDAFETFLEAVHEDPDIDAELSVDARSCRNGAWRTITVSRLVRCPSCAASPYRGERGCARCRRGFVLRSEALALRIPEGTLTGAKLRMRGKGHELPTGAAGDVIVRIDVVSPAATAGRVLTQPRVVLAVVALGALVGLYVHDRSKRRELGESCGRADDCRSGECLTLYAAHPDPLPGARILSPPRRTGAVCTTNCDDDSDCPASMQCAPVEKTSTFPGMIDLGPGAPNAAACAPREP